MGLRSGDEEVRSGGEKRCQKERTKEVGEMLEQRKR